MKRAPSAFVPGISMVVASVAIPAARAQELVEDVFGSSAYEQFGASLAANGPDLDGDGLPEIAVGAPGRSASPTAPFVGAVEILSGSGRDLLKTLDGSGANEWFGSYVAWCGDADGDGLGDLAVCSLGLDVVRVYSSADWSLLHTLAGGAAPFTASVAPVPDLDGDGFDELLVGSPETDTVRLYSLADGVEIRTIPGTASTQFGFSVGMVGDVDDDGTPDLGVGAPWSAINDPDSGSCFVYSGADGSLLQQWHGSSFLDPDYGWLGNELGSAIGAAGDIDGDGTDDVYFATYTHETLTGCYVRIGSGATGATLRTLPASNDGVQQVAAIGDVDGDGLTELLSGTGDRGFNRVQLYSSIDGSSLWRADLRGVGSSVSAAGDLDGDARPDFAYGSSYWSSTYQSDGKASFFASDDHWLDVSPSHYVYANWKVDVAISRGPSGNPAALFLLTWNGVGPAFLLALGAFDGSSRAAWSFTVPAGLIGQYAELLGVGINAAGRVVSTSPESIGFF